MNNRIRKFNIVSNDTTTIGIFTIVELLDVTGASAVGISRCSERDKFDETVGESIARGRAFKSLFNKKRNKRSQIVLAG